jgi:DNA-binding winged helix-turn-helix (wHTH) protein
MSRHDRQLYEFGPFALDPDEQSLMNDGEPIPLAPKAFSVLLVLVRNAGRTVGKDEIMRAVWPDTFVEEQNVGLNVYLVRKALGDDTDHPRYVATVPRRGYRFVAPVRRGCGVEAVQSVEGVTKLIPETAAPKQPREMGAWLSYIFGEHGVFVLASCALYAVLYAVALFVEVAYQFDRYGIAAAKIAPLVFLWMWVTSVFGLEAGRRLTLRGELRGLTFSVMVFSLAGLMLYGALGWFLPNVPITKARFQTYPAYGAYLKSIYYFLPLAVIFLVLPYHFVIAARREVRAGGGRLALALLIGRRLGAAPAGVVYVKRGWLSLTLAVAAVAALVATAHLLENLVPGEYTSFFTQLVQWRLALYFAFGMVCLVWYSRALDEIKRECVGLRTAA